VPRCRAAISEEDCRDLGPQQSSNCACRSIGKEQGLDSLIRLKLVQAEAKKRSISAEKLIDRKSNPKLRTRRGEVEAILGQTGPATLSNR